MVKEGPGNVPLTNGNFWKLKSIIERENLLIFKLNEKT